MLNDILEIIIVTYNRKKYIAKTLKQILNDKSPIRNLDITILDNKSTDGTSELIEEYKKDFPNIKHIINNRNIGGNANIAKAFAESSKKYVWVLCDDDKYNFTHFDAIEKKVLSLEYDAIFTVKCEDNIADEFYQATFVPACIYRTDIITNAVLENAFSNVPNMFPHNAIIASIINDNGKIATLGRKRSQIIIRGQENDAKGSYLRGMKHNELTADRRYIYWYIGYMNSLRLLINDKKKRTYIIDHTSHCCNNSFELITHKLWMNMFLYKFYYKNFLDIFIALNLRQKIFMFFPGLIIAFLRFLIGNKDPLPCSIKEWDIWFKKHQTLKKIDALFEKYKDKKILYYGTGLITKTILMNNHDFYKKCYAISDMKISKSKKRKRDGVIEIPPFSIRKHDEIDVIFISVYRYDIIKKYLKKLGVKTKMVKIL